MFTAVNNMDATDEIVKLLDAQDEEEESFFDHTAMSEDDIADQLSRLSHTSRMSVSIHPRNSAYLTTFLLLNSMIGSGILNQPYVFRESGIAGGFLGFLIASLGTWFGVVLLTEAGVKEDVLEFSGLAHRAFGQVGETMVDVSIIVLSFGAQLGYILIVGDTLTNLLDSWGCQSGVCSIYYVTLISVGLFVTPTCLFRTFGHLAFLSIFSIGTIAAVLFLVLIGGPMKYKSGTGPIKVFDVEGFLASTGSIVFSLSCASANFQAYISTVRKSRNFNSWTKITGTAVFSGAVMCMTMGIAGYLSFRDDTDGEILVNFPQAGFDVFKMLVVIHLILYIPVNFVIMRYSIVKAIWGMKSENLPYWSHTALSLFLLCLTTATVLIMLYFGIASGKAFALILDISGGLGGALSSFIMPAAIYLKVMPDAGYLRWLAWVILVLGFSIMFTVLTFTILNAV